VNSNARSDERQPIAEHSAGRLRDLAQVLVDGGAVRELLGIALRRVRTMLSVPTEGRAARPPLGHLSASDRR
jgi:hypothetical protein